MAKAKHGDKVKVHYTGTLEDGTVFDSSRGGDPLEFTIGAGDVIPGFEEAVVGLNPGESTQKSIPSEQAYGDHQQGLEVEIDRAQFPAGVDLDVGQAFELRAPDGNSIAVRVTALTEQTVTLDGNHPLAGQALKFDIELVEILAA